MTVAPTGLEMNRRRFLLASLGGLGAVALGSCSPRRPGGGGTGATVRLPHGALGFPSPFAANADIGYSQMSLLYDTLLWKDGSGRLLPWLAESFQTTADHLTYSFRLRQGVTWSDGRPLTADDVVFTFDYYAAQGSLSPPVIVQPPQGIAKVRAGGPLTVEITLSEPQVTFPEHVAGAVPIVPKHVWATVDDPGGVVEETNMLVGSGPYRLASYDGDGGAMLFVGRKDYFLGTPYVTRIEQLALEDPISALASDSTDAARGLGLRTDILRIFDNDAFGRITEQGSTTSALYWNLGKEGALADVRFRQACLMAIDRQDLVDRLVAGRGVPGNPGFLSPQNPFFTPVRQYEFDPLGASGLLDGAGYRMGADGVRQDRRGPLRFELLAGTGDEGLAQILVASLKRIGVDLKPKLVAVGPLLFGAKFVGDYDMAILFFPGPGPGGPNADPDLLRLLFSSTVPPSLQSASAYANPAFDDLADRQRSTFDEGERKAHVAEMQRLLADDVPVVPLFYPEVTLLFRKSALDRWYFTPGQFPTPQDNKQLFITGTMSGTEIRSR